MPLLRIRLFGVFELWRGDHLVTLRAWPNRKTRDLCKLLLTERDHVLSAERIVDALWPELTPASATNSLRVAVSRLRSVLEPARVLGAGSSFVATAGQGYIFRSNPDVWLDVDAFASAVALGQEAERRGAWGPAASAYEAAAELYRGDYLEENPYDDWALAAREQLRLVRLDMLSRLGHCHAQQQHYRRALAACRQVLAVDLLRESAHRQIMLYHYQLGERDQALLAYERCHHALIDELGVDPLPETQELHARILREDLLQASPVALGVAPGRPLPSERPLPTWLPFVGRNAAMTALADALQRAQAGAFVVFVSGEAGIGKSRLCDEFLAYAADQGAEVIKSRAYELEQDLPYQPLREALRNYLLQSATRDVLQRMLGPRGRHLALLLPALRQFVPELPLPDPAPAAEERARLQEALTGFFEELVATRLTVLLFEDLHWADSATLGFISRLVHSAARMPLLIVATYRDDRIVTRDALRALELGLLRDGLALRLPLARLTPDDVAGLVSACATGGWDSAAFGRQLYQETEGNPLFLTEMLRNLFLAQRLAEDSASGWRPTGGNAELIFAGLPLSSTIHDLIAARCAEPSDDARSVLRVAAVIGRAFEVGLLQRVLAMEPEPLLRALDDLAARQLIEEQLSLSEVGYRFRHDKIREVAYNGLSQGWRQHLHARVADALEASIVLRSPETEARLAHHYVLAGNSAKAVEYLLLAADQARSLYESEQAVVTYERALALLSPNTQPELRARTLMKLGLTHQIAFDHLRAREAYDGAFRLWQQAGGRIQAAAGSGRELRIGWTLNVTTLDPNLAWDANSTGVVDQLFCGLAEHSAELEVIPDLAERWTSLDGGRRFVFRLRQGLTWSDGMPLTAADFVCSWRRVLDPATRSPVALLLHDLHNADMFHGDETEALGVEALDDVTLMVELEQQSPHFLQLLSHNVCYPLPRHCVAQRGPAWSAPAVIVTNGPFQLENWRAGEVVTMRRNPRYEGRFEGNVTGLELHLQADQRAGVALYDAGEIDILRLDHPQELGIEILRRRYADQYVSIAMLHTAFLGCIADAPPLNDARVRRALALATDREQLANVVMQGFVAPATGGFVPPGMPGHTAVFGTPYDPERARALLAEAGFPRGRGFPALEGRIVEAERWRRMSAHLQRQWQETLGIETFWTGGTMRPGTFADRALDPPAHLFLTGWFADYPDPDTYLRACPLLHYTGWQDRDYAALIAQAGRALNQAERLALYRQAEAILMAGAAIIPLTYGREHRLVKPWVKRLPTSTIKWWLWKDVVIEPDRVAISGYQPSDEGSSRSKRPGRPGGGLTSSVSGSDASGSNAVSRS